MSFQEIGLGFVDHYYRFFSSERTQLAGIYRPNTLLTWQREQMQGVDAIMARFASLGFTEAAFKQDNVDCQPSMSGGVMIVVNGEVKLKDEQHSLKYNDVFHLARDNDQWYVSNQIFNIVGGGGQ